MKGRQSPSGVSHRHKETKNRDKDGWIPTDDKKSLEER